MFQMKKQDKTIEELSEVDISNLPEEEFKEMILKMVKKLGRRLYEKSENSKVSNKEFKNIKMNQTRNEEYNTLNFNNILEGIHSRITDTQDWMRDLKNKVVEITETEDRSRDL